MLAPKGPTFNGRPTFANPMYLKKAQYEKPCLYKIPYDQSDPANRLVPDREETLTLKKESRSKLNKDLVRPYDYTKLNNEIDELESDKAEFSNMYDMLLQECVSNDVMCSYLHSLSDLDAYNELQCLYLHKVKECDCLAQKLSKQTEFVKQMKNDTVYKEKASNVFQKEREQYFEIQDLKAQLQDKNIAIILGKPTPFSDSLERNNFVKKKSVSKTNESEGLSKPVTSQNLPQTASQAVRNTNVIKPGMYRIESSTTQTRAPQLTQTSRNTNPRVSTSTGVAHRTNVSRPQHSLKHVRTSMIIAACATCGKCGFNLNHDACVSKYLNDVNARTKKPKVVPISTRKLKSQANKSVATPHKKTVALESTTQKSKSYYRMLYEKTSKAWKCWIEQQCLSGYERVLKTKMK
ncbi:hypothetical protein Tco_0496919 [Tanacetum coccineum]